MENNKNELSNKQNIIREGIDMCHVYLDNEDIDPFKNAYLIANNDQELNNLTNIARNNKSTIVVVLYLNFLKISND